MSFIRYDKPLKVMVIVGGHPFDRSAFAEMFDGMDDIAVTFVDHPAAERLLNPEGTKGFDALLFYDVPGIDLWGGVTQQKPTIYPTSMEIREGFAVLQNAGVPMVFLHHAIAGRPDWDEYASCIGGRFQYLTGQLHGRIVGDSGYIQNVTYEALNVAPTHPVMAGIPASFTLTDELYLYEVDEDEILPLLVAEFPFDDSRFFSAEAAVKHGRMHCNEGWQHPAGSNALAWVKASGRSPVAYIQPGDGIETYINPHYRRLVENALHWASSTEAKEWARSQSCQGDQ